MFQECKMISKYLTHPCIHLTHLIPHCLAVKLDVCGGVYTIGTQNNLSEQQTFLPPYAVMSFFRVCAV